MKIKKLLLASFLLALLLNGISSIIPLGQAPVSTYLETTSITGRTLVALPCEGASDVLHDRRGIPLDIIWYTTCDGMHILALPVLLNTLFWFVAVSAVGILYTHFRHNQ
jgi:hypothetical protein